MKLLSSVLLCILWLSLMFLGLHKYEQYDSFERTRETSQRNIELSLQRSLIRKTKSSFETLYSIRIGAYFIVMFRPGNIILENNTIDNTIHSELHASSDSMSL